MSEATSTTDLPQAGNPLTSRAREVLAYQADRTRPGRPLSLLFGGGAVAGLCAVFMGLLAYRTFYLQVVPESWGYTGIGLLFSIYVCGLFLFAYAWELYDMYKAVRLTLILAIASVVALFVMIATFAVLAKLKAGASLLESGGSGAKGSVSPGASRTADTILQVAGSLMLGDNDVDAPAEPRARSRFDPPQRDPLPPFVIVCDGCGDTFTPLPPRGVCPGCGRAAVSAS